MNKIATMMYKAMQSSDAMIDHEEDMSAGGSMMDLNLSSKVHTLKAAR